MWVLCGYQPDFGVGLMWLSNRLLWGYHTDFNVVFPLKLVAFAINICPRTSFSLFDR